MKRKVGYGLLVAVTAALAVTRKSQFLYFLLAFEFFFAAAMALWVHSVVKKLSVSLSLSDSVIQRGSELRVQLQVTNPTRFPVGELKAWLVLRDIQNENRMPILVRTGAAGRGTDAWQTTLTPEHCGVLELSVTEIRIFDYIGLWSAKGTRLPGSRLVSVLPRICPEALPGKRCVTETMASAEENVTGSERDTQEVCDTRLYQRGDTLRMVHWKLSAKENDLLVKEFSTAAKTAQMIVADSSCEHPEAVTLEARDLFYERIGAFAAGLLENNQPCEILWYSSAEQAVNMERVESEESLYRALEALLGAVPHHGAGEINAWLEEYGTFPEGTPFTVVLEGSGEAEAEHRNRMQIDIAQERYIPDEKRPKRRRESIFMSFFMVASFSLLLLGIFLSAFEVEAVHTVLITAVLIMSTFFTWFFLEGRLDGSVRVLVSLFLLVLYGAVCFLFQSEIERGFYWVADTVVRRINYVYDGNLSMFYSGTKLDGTAFLLAVLFPVNGILAAGMVRRPYFALILSVLFPVLAVSVAAGGQPDFVWLYFVCIGMFVIFAASRSLVPGWSVAVFAGMLAIGISLPSWGMMQAAGKIPENGFSKRAAKLETKLLQSVWRLLPQISGGRLQMSVEGIGGGVENGVLGAVDGYFFSGTEALRVTSSQKPRETVYLKGYIGEQYTGNRFETGSAERFQNASVSWNTEGNSSVYVQNLPFLRMMYYENFGETEPVENSAEKQSTSTDNGKEEGLQTTANTISVENLNANTAYTYVPYLSFLNDNYQIYGGDGYTGGQTIQDDVFPCYWRESYREAMEARRDAGNGDSVLDRVEAQYRAYCEQGGLETPEEGIDRLKEACEKAVEENKWDLEQSLQRPAWEIADEIAEIRQYILKVLMTSCNFELDVDALPEGADFVEHFLYETGEGYSMHFAAAATIMFRLCGVPARYVVGYVAPKEIFTENEDGSWSAVLQDDNAHAWTEIYQPFLGWMPVEVTPGMEAELSEEFYMQEERVQEPTEGLEDETENVRAGKEASAAGQIAEYIAKNWIGIAAGILSVVLTALAGWSICRLRKARKHRLGVGLEPRERILALYRSLYRLLVYAGMSEEYSIMENKMLPEYFAQIYEAMTEKELAAFKILILEASFGGQELTQTDADHMQNLYQASQRKLRKKLPVRKRIKYFMEV
ncbi:MAG: DUF58 domain-containing protein [Lachnospiraceae bacterium]|jgi:uncharacterized protein (DUF58 family)|nr:DUF58 domain-containing protein [Lachnospiraceae bacterium]